VEFWSDFISYLRIYLSGWCTVNMKFLTPKLKPLPGTGLRSSREKKNPSSNSFLGSETPTVVAVGSSITWHIMPSTPVKVSWQFGGLYHLHLQGKIVSQARNQLCLRPASCLLLTWLTLWPWRWRWYDLMKRWTTFSEHHGIAPQMTEILWQLWIHFINL
jgi:hypothetical protein